MAVKRSLSSLLSLSLFRLLMVQDSNDPEQAVPLTTAMLGSTGGGGGTGGGAVTSTLPPQALTVNASVSSLTVPAGATHATVHVVTGSVRRSIGGAPSGSTPTLNAGDSEEISGAELTAYRLVRSGDADAQVSVEYRVVG